MKATNGEWRRRGGSARMLAVLALAAAAPVLRAGPALSIPAQLPPSGQIGVPYSYGFQVNGGIPPYVWSVGMSGSLPTGLSLSSSGVLSGTPSAAGTSTFTIQVADNAMSPPTSQSFTIVVLQPPTITTSTLPVSGGAGFPYNASLAAAGGVPPYTWSMPGGAVNGISLSSTGMLTGVPVAAGNFTLAVQVTDSLNSVAMKSLTLSVTPPLLVISGTAPPSGVAGQTYAGFQFNATGGLSARQWSLLGGSPPPGLSLSSGGSLQGTPLTAGQYTFTVQVYDGFAPAQASFTITVSAPTPITISSGSPPQGLTGQPYAGFQFSASGGLAAKTWSVFSGSLPPGLTLSSGGSIQGTPQTKGQYSFVIQVTDGFGPTQQAYSIAVYDPLTVTAASLPGAYVNQSYSATAVTITGGSGLFSVNASGAPANMSVSSTGVLSGTPGTAGTFSISVSVSDNTSNQSASATVSLSVAYLTVSITGSPNLGGFALGAGISKGFTAAGGKQPFAWSSSGLPAGLTLDPNSGALSGTASQTGSFSFSITVTDSQTPPATASITANFRVLGVTTTALPEGTTAAMYAATLSASGGLQPYSWSASGLPPGVSLSSGGALSGTPTTAGTYPVGVTVTDGGALSASANLSIVVVAGALPLAVPTTTLSDGMVTTPYSGALGASGGTIPYSWSIIGGSLPAGLQMDGTGAISGTPTATGTSSFTAQATDKNGKKASGAITLTVDPSALTLSAASLPNGIVGTEYPAQIFTAAGGTIPYNFSITSGSLPPGMGLSGNQLTGTPSGAGTYSFTITVADSQMPKNQTVSAALSIMVAPANADLAISQSSVGFSLMSPATGVPAGASITVRSSVVLQILNYTVSVAPAVGWLSVSTGASTTPGGISVSLTAGALTLAPSATPYQTAITVACVAPSPCMGHSQTIGVSLSVTAAPPQLSVQSTLLSFFATTSNPAAGTQTLGIQNTGGGSLPIQSVTAADSWVTLSGVPAAVSAGPAVNVAVGVNTANLSPGYYRSTITVNTSVGSAEVAVSLLYAASGSLSLNPGGLQFSMQAGGAVGNPNGSFQVAAQGAPSISWSASITSINGGNWLNLGTTAGTSTPALPGAVSFSIDPTASAALAVGNYYANIQLTPTGNAMSAPANETVVLSVTASTTQARPNPQPAGFVATRFKGDGVFTQTVQVFVSSATALNYQASASTTDGNGWLSVSPQSGTSSASAPGQSTVTLNPANLAAGVYYGGVSYAFAGAAVRTVNVTMVVIPQSATPSSNTPSPAGDAVRSESAHATGSCTPTILVPTQTGLVSNFSQPTAWPTALTVKVIDNCGAPVNGAQSVATFTNGDPPLPLRQTDTSSGIYAGTWTPRATNAQVTVAARVTANGFPAAVTQITGQVTPNAAPLITPHGTVHAFAPQIGGQVGQGNIVAIYGQNLAPQTMQAPATPLPTTLGGTQVLIGGVPAPLYFTSPGQINAQVPYELAAGNNYQVVVNANGALSTPDGVQVAGVAPGIAAFPTGQIIAVHLDASLVTEASPAMPGETIVFYLAGLGVTNTAIASGVAAPLTQLLLPVATPSLTLNGIPEPVAFAGLSPGFVGLYQINFQIPANAPAGDLQLVVTQPGATSNSTILPVGAASN